MIDHNNFMTNTYTPKPTTWTLFKNGKKTKQEQPDYTGSAMIELPDGTAVEYRLSAWKRNSKTGAQFIGGFIKPKEAQKSLLPEDGEHEEKIW